MGAAQITGELARRLSRTGQSLVSLIGPIFVRALRSRRHFTAGHELVAAGQHERAAAAYAAGLAYKPSAFHIWIQYGCALKDAGKFNEAATAFDRALLLDAADANLHVLIKKLNTLAATHGLASEDYRPAGRKRRRSLSPEGLAALLRLVPEPDRPELRNRHGKDAAFVPLVLRASRRPGATTEPA